MPTTKLTIIALALLAPVTGNASLIRERTYRFSFEAAIAREEQQFVVCANCPDSSLTLLPVTPQLAVRLTVPERAQSSLKPRDQVEPVPAAPAGKPAVHTETVLFAFGSAHLSAHEQLRLSELLKEFPDNDTLDITGYTCTIGTDAYNEQLALHRAQEVAAFLTKGGLTIGGVSGRGKCCPVSTDKRLNRRVEIRGHERGRNEDKK